MNRYDFLLGNYPPPDSTGNDSTAVEGLSHVGKVDPVPFERNVSPGNLFFQGYRGIAGSTRIAEPEGNLVMMPDENVGIGDAEPSPLYNNTVNSSFTMNDPRIEGNATDAALNVIAGGMNAMTVNPNSIQMWDGRMIIGRDRNHPINIDGNLNVRGNVLLQYESSDPNSAASRGYVDKINRKLDRNILSIWLALTAIVSSIITFTVLMFK